MLKFLALIAILSLSACGHYPGRDTQDTCHEIVGLPQGNLLLFGEIHGSVEAPALIENISCSLSKSQPVAVGLEYPSSDQNLILAYLASGGTTADKEKLLDTYFWQKNIDGRSSTAMLQLIERIRTLKNAGHQIDLFAFDDQPGTELERNVAIANGIRRFHTSHPKVKIVALMGNVHAMQAPMGSGEERMLPSGYLLKDLEPVSILVQYPKGTIWACFSGDCRIHDLAPRTVSSDPPGFRSGASLQGYSHSYLLPSITASPPAIFQGHGG